MSRVGILGVRVREKLLISSSTLPELRRSSGTATANPRTFTPPFPSLIMTRHPSQDLNVTVLLKNKGSIHSPLKADINSEEREQEAVRRGEQGQSKLGKVP